MYRDLWPGIDLHLRDVAGTLKYEFRVRPGTSPTSIRLAYNGADDLALDDSGALLINTAMGVLTDARPISYQMIDNTRVMHGRRAFTDAGRQIYVRMCRSVTW